MRVLGLVWSRIAQHSKEREKAKKRTEQKERQEAGNERQSGRRLYYLYLHGLPKEPLSPMSIVVMVTLSEVVHPYPGSGRYLFPAVIPAVL